jgi:hypothetical protein
MVEQQLFEEIPGSQKIPLKNTSTPKEHLIEMLLSTAEAIISNEIV